MNYRATPRVLAPLILAAAAAGLVAQDAAPLPGREAMIQAELADLIRIRIEGAHAVGSHINIDGERIHAAVELPRFYERRGFAPAWVDETGPLAVADSLLWAIERAVLEGLEPSDYHVAKVRDMYALVRRARRADTVADHRRLAELDLLLTDAFLVYGGQLVGGRVDPVRIHPEWSAARREADLVAKLELALESGRVGETLDLLLPRHPGYARLRETLRQYREIAAWGGWPEQPGRTLRPGMRDAAVVTLREQLRMTGDLPRTADPADAELFDDELAAGVRRFQARHALTVDGVVGLETNAVLNVPVEERIRQIELNMERWRWLPRELGARHIVVNIAGFEMDVMEGDSSIFNSRVMVGQLYRRTPVFSDLMTYLVLNPTWTIPPGILEQDKLPLIRRDPGYLARNRIRVFRPDGREANPATIDWAQVTGRTALRFRMDPGPENPLGRVKFMFPNPYHVYLHDTPGREGFARADRAFSSGCIRVERSRELTELLLPGATGWDPQRIAAAMTGATERTVTLPRPLPVHLLYWTAWAEPDGAVHFRTDVYQRDGPLDEALRMPPPRPVARAGATGAVPGAR